MLRALLFVGLVLWIASLFPESIRAAVVIICGLIALAVYAYRHEVHVSAQVAIGAAIAVCAFGAILVWGGVLRAG